MALEQKKSELSITKPDSTFARYSYDQFKKSRSAKSVPHESLDFTIYKSSSNCVAFLTSEERLIKWIQAIYERYHVRLQDATTTSKMKAVWEELQNVSDTSKTDKISVHLSLQNDDIVENIVTIIIYCTTGIIQIQGKSLHEWGDVEFNVLRNMVYISTPNCEKETPTGTNNSTSPTTPILSTEEQPLTTHYTIPISNMFNPLDNDCEENGKPTTKKTVTAETIILCDSNGKHLDPKLLCPGSPTQYIRCPTVNGATKILDEYEFTSPQTFVIHSGTNDIETTNCKEQP